MALLVAIIGGAGRLGKSLATELRDRGHGVRVFDLPTMDFSGLENIEQIKGDITDAQAITAALKEAQAVIHLAALMPPKSEADREVTWRINVEGTRNVVDAISSLDPSVHLIFSSSVATYGDTTRESHPIRVDCPQQALDVYSETKVTAEEVIKASPLSWTILRIAGIAVPELLEPPEVWPFQQDQRVEFVNRDDVALAIANCVGNDTVRGQVLNIGGGLTWQIRGWQYVKGYYDIYELSLDEARFQDYPGWIDWYDTEDSQRLLNYQQTSWQDFLDQLTRVVEEALA